MTPHWTDLIKATASDRFIDNAKKHATVSDWWNECHDAKEMLWVLETIGYNNTQVLRLLACRIVRETRVDDTRTVWDLLDEHCRAAIIVAERYANGEVTEEELAVAFNTVWVAGETEGTAARAAVLYAARNFDSDNVPAAQSARFAAVEAMVAVEEVGDGFEVGVFARSQQACIVREMISVEEVVLNFERREEEVQEVASLLGLADSITGVMSVASQVGAAEIPDLEVAMKSATTNKGDQQ